MAVLLAGLTCSPLPSPHPSSFSEPASCYYPVQCVRPASLPSAPPGGRPSVPFIVAQWFISCLFEGAVFWWSNGGGSRSTRLFSPGAFWSWKAPGAMKGGRGWFTKTVQREYKENTKSSKPLRGVGGRFWNGY
ncbi:hypothetical protein ES703_58726 [subsurface metagenome]